MLMLFNKTLNKNKTLYKKPELKTIYNWFHSGVISYKTARPIAKYSKRVKNQNRKATTINKALRKLIKQIGADNIKLIIFDNGVELAYSKVIEVSYNLYWYYCDLYKSGQRGQNERLNRDIRKYHLKGCNFHRLSDKSIENTINKINDYPRRKFNGLSANEMAISVRKNVV